MKENNNVNSKLIMQDLVFSQMSYELKKKTKDTEFKTSISVKYAEKKDNKNQVRVTIDTTITNDEDTLRVYLQTVGYFKLDAENIDDATAEQILKKNTVAIMFPYIRSQVSLITTQPAMVPIIMPPIDVNALVDNQNNIN